MRGVALELSVAFCRLDKHPSVSYLPGLRALYFRAHVRGCLLPSDDGKELQASFPPDYDLQLGIEHDFSITLKMNGFSALQALE